MHQTFFKNRQQLNFEIVFATFTSNLRFRYYRILYFYVTTSEKLEFEFSLQIDQTVPFLQLKTKTIP